MIWSFEPLTEADFTQMQADTEEFLQSFPSEKETARLLQEYCRNFSWPTLQKNTPRNTRRDKPSRWQPTIEHIEILVSEICDNLNKSQRALLAAKIANLKKGSNQFAIESPSQSEAAKLLQVSVPYLKLARRLQSVGNTRLIKAVASGKFSLRKAIDIVKLPKTKQAKALKIPA